ncbi:MAG: carboxypeptidase regulatory-like domain-containing protein [Chloroflexi bacterium]|nr:carboxypeptidase regulatory-like domain-containing protein [Chloroflexota bacterium]
MDFNTLGGRARAVPYLTYKIKVIITGTGLTSPEEHEFTAAGTYRIELPGGLKVIEVMALDQADTVLAHRITSATVTGGQTVNVDIDLGVTITESGFLPPSITIFKGTTLLWINGGTQKHTVTQGEGFDSGPIPPGGSWSYTFDTVGTFNYGDTNTSMIGSVTVTNSTGTISGVVRDAVSSSPLAGVSIAVDDQRAVIATGTTQADGTYSIQTPAGRNYRVDFTKTGYLPVISYGVNVNPDAVTYLEAVAQVDTAHSGPGDISGNIRNALNAQGVTGLTVDLRSGVNVTTGTIIATTTTQAGGAYSFTNIDAGNYTAYISGTGFEPAHFSVVSIGGTATANQNGTVTPVLLPGQTRIVLIWGQTPSDLDSHLTGPSMEGGRFHVYYSAKTYISGGVTYAELDLDDTSSYGPETTTVYTQTEGVYRFSVHDYSNKSSTSSYALSNSGAQVKIYRGGSEVGIFNVPNNTIGTLWTVFEMNGDMITPVNTMTNQSSSGSVTSVPDGSDEELIKDLPGKD